MDHLDDFDELSYWRPARQVDSRTVWAEVPEAHRAPITVQYARLGDPTESAHFLPRVIKLCYACKGRTDEWSAVATVGGSLVRPDGSVIQRRFLRSYGPTGPMPVWVADYVLEHHPDTDTLVVAR
ncbi:hypothetical protein [Actinoalloteichus sp. GBA129-24]|uniref:hypothetical protein n=1 Tax=Actinoalloteichus sp. GBA129-24 TaxID=1612551 RepID=UPI000950A7C6|nr:hypothetical protein [Actinoalloteichus sp. GBA129-24]APU18608.1 hypothetical protein UA75_02845 [Actinoalloteichus sp. GBA129-24]